MRSSEISPGIFRSIATPAPSRMKPAHKKLKLSRRPADGNLPADGPAVLGQLSDTLNFRCCAKKMIRPFLRCLSALPGCDGFEIQFDKVQLDEDSPRIAADRPIEAIDSPQGR